MRGVTAVLLLSLFGPVTNVSAQVLWPLRPGTRVRVTGTDCGVRGRATTIEAIRGDKLVFPGESTASGGFIVPVECPIHSISRLEVSRGRKSHWLAGMGFGILTGAGVGALAGGAWSSCTHEWGSLCTMVGAGAGASIGLLTGLTAGALVVTERWEKLPLDRLRVSIVRQLDEFALRVLMRQ